MCQQFGLTQLLQEPTHLQNIRPHWYTSCPIAASFNFVVPFFYFIFILFLPFDFCRFCVVIRSFFIPATTVNDLRLRRIFNPRFYPLHLFSYLNSWERAIIFPFECSVLNKGTTVVPKTRSFTRRIYKCNSCNYYTLRNSTQSSDWQNLFDPNISSPNSLRIHLAPSLTNTSPQNWFELTLLINHG